MTLYLDIETIPLREQELWELKESFDEVRPRMTFADYVARTALSGDWGRIVCIGYAIDEEPAQVLAQREEDMLVKFWDIAKEADLFVGHFILGFDLPFLYRRSAALKIEPSIWLTPEKRTLMVRDTKLLWRQENPGVKMPSSLDHIARHFGLRSPKEKMSGQDVWMYYQRGQLEEICQYCQYDVEVTREIYKRLSVLT